MAEHDVQVDIPEVWIGKKDAVFNVYADGGKRGRLTASKGGVGWKPFKGKKELHLSWEKFDLAMQNFGCK
jgi:hypothetical protein